MLTNLIEPGLVIGLLALGAKKWWHTVTKSDAPTLLSDDIFDC